MPNAPSILLYDAAPTRADQLEQRLAERGLTARRLELNAGVKGGGVFEDRIAVLLLDAPLGTSQADAARGLVDELKRQRIGTLVWGAGEAIRSSAGPLTELLGADVSLDEIVGKIGTLARYAPLVRGFERELEHLQRLGEQLNHYFSEIDQEMRLAGRLQQDFLPRKLPQVPPYHFHAVYRPASWVSGDMYDVFRIDEHHLGLFVADAMGHGVAAGLLTMFLRQALVAKRIDGNAYSILSPREALDNLNNSLVRQRLPNCQFVTASYAIIDTRSNALLTARAGHPYTLRITPDGRIDELRVEGSLLGLADIPAEFEQTQVTLDPGDKLLLYTDGIEDVFIMPHEDAAYATYTPNLQAWAPLSAADMVRAIEEHLDGREGSLHPADDITVLIAEVSGG